MFLILSKALYACCDKPARLIAISPAIEADSIAKDLFSVL
jgi:hypothetical protein